VSPVATASPTETTPFAACSGAMALGISTRPATRAPFARPRVVPLIETQVARTSRPTWATHHDGVEHLAEHRGVGHVRSADERGERHTATVCSQWGWCCSRAPASIAEQNLGVHLHCRSLARGTKARMGLVAFGSFNRSGSGPCFDRLRSTYCAPAARRHSSRQ
jgi:hypothetical protein